jgi:DNA-binding MarR family transcriptional regulator
MMTAIEHLFDETRLMWHRMVQVGEALHAREAVTLGMRAVLEVLLLRGPATVPALARGRGVTRQHIQVLVDALSERGLVVPEPNPAHRRSPLVRLTSTGERAIRRMRRREARFYEKLQLGVSAASLDHAAKTLRAVRTALKGEE